MFNKKIIFIILFSVFLFQGKTVLADVVGLSADQSIFSFSMNPGEKKTFVVNVQNISDYSEKIKITSDDFSFGENNEIANIVEENEMSGMKEWISAEEKDSIELGSKDKKELKLTVAVPENAAIGSHYALVLISAIPQTEEQELKSTLVSGRVGIYILVNVSGEVSGKGSLNSFKAPILAGKKAVMKMEFENKGNIHYIPHGEVRIKNLVTKQTQKLEVEKHFVFPGKKYLFELNWNGASLFGVYRAQAFFIDGSKSVHVLDRLILGKVLFAIIIILIVLFISVCIFRKKISVFLKSLKYKKKTFKKT